MKFLNLIYSTLFKSLKISIGAVAIVSLTLSLFFDLTIAGETPVEINDSSTQSNTATNQSDPVYNDPNLLRRFNEYQTMSLTYSDLYPDASRKGFTATDSEVNLRMKSYAEMFPSLPISEDVVREEIATQKYLVKNYNAKVTNDQLKNVYNDLNDTTVRFDDVLLFLKSKAILENKNVTSLLEEKKEELNRSIAQQQQSQMYYWHTDSLKIKGEQSACIIDESGECLLNVGQFGQGVAVHPISRSFPLDSARIQVLYMMLVTLNKSRQARSAGFADKADLTGKIAAWLSKRYEYMIFSRTGPMIGDENSLHASYEKHFANRFCSRTTVNISVIASTDSQYIDSLYRNAIEPISDSTKTTVKSNTHNTKSAIDSLPWTQCLIENFPPYMRKNLAQMDEKQICPPVRISYGYCLFRIDKKKFIPEVSFDQARDVLTLLATKDKWLHTDSLNKEKAYTYFKTHKDEFLTPDTFVLTTWLKPSSDTTGFNKQSKDSIIARLHNIAKSDTQHIQSLTMQDTELPDSIRLLLHKTYASRHPGQLFFSNIHCAPGVWHFLIRDIKPGGKQQSYFQVQDELVKRFNTKEKADSTEFLTSWYTRECAIAGLYSDELEKHERLFTDEQIREKINDYKIDVSKRMESVPEEQRSFFLRSLLKEHELKFQMEITNQWVSSLIRKAQIVQN